MSVFEATILKVRCDPCLGWGNMVHFEKGERVQETCHVCGGKGWVETRVLLLREKKERR